MSTITSAAAGSWTATGTWTGGVLPGLSDIAKPNHQVTLDANVSVGGIDSTGTGCIVAGSTVNSYRILVGSGQIMYVARGVNVS